MKLFSNSTKHFGKTLLVFCFASAVAATAVFGQITLSFDENGHATGIPNGFLGPDPSGGVVGTPVLIYSLPFGVVPGDVLLTEETNNPNALPSDIIRFWNPTGNPNQSQMIFYSDISESTNEIRDLADVGLPVQLQSNVGGPFTETGTDASNFYDYTSVLFMPGSGATGPIQYHIVSDGVVPEPNTCVLVVLGSGLLLGLKRRFQSRRQ